MSPPETQYWNSADSSRCQSWELSGDCGTWARKNVAGRASEPPEVRIVKAANGKLTTMDKAGINQHTHDVPLTATITCDGKECKLKDLQEGLFVKITTGQDETAVTQIEGTTEKANPMLILLTASEKEVSTAGWRSGRNWL